MQLCFHFARDGHLGLAGRPPEPTLHVDTACKSHSFTIRPYTTVTTSPIQRLIRIDATQQQCQPICGSDNR